MDKKKLMLEYLDCAYPDVKLKINEFTDSVVYANKHGDWFTERLILSRKLSSLFSCLPNDAHTTIIKWERSKLV